MKCFTHEEIEAIGICLCCHHGLCRACAIEVERRLSCSGPCADEIKAQFAMVRRNIRRSQFNSWVVYSTIGMALFLSSVSLTMSTLSVAGVRWFLPSGSIAGVVFASTLAFLIYYRRKTE